MFDLQAIERRTVSTTAFPGCVVLPAEDFAALCNEAKALSWILCNCELRDGDNTHVDIDDVYEALDAEGKES